jgi:hypothetical protein
LIAYTITINNYDQLSNRTHSPFPSLLPISKN